MSTICLILVPSVIRGMRTLRFKDLKLFSFIGIILAIHWVFLYGSVKYSNASIALCGLATTALFTSILEPLFFRTRVRFVEVLLGLIVIVGILLIFRTTPDRFNLGILLGLIAALLAALFSILNKKYVHRGDSGAITAVEMGSGFLLMTLLLPLYFIWFPQTTIKPQVIDWILLGVMCLFCTAIPMVISLRALKHISAFASNVALNLEPIYGMILAWLIFKENEELSSTFYFGALMIIGSVMIHPLLESSRVKNKVKVMLGRS